MVLKQSKIILIFCLIGQLVIFINCTGSKPQDKPCTSGQKRLEKPTTNASATGSAAFNSNYHVCNDYVDTDIWLVVNPPTGDLEFKQLALNDLINSQGWDGTAVFTHTLTQVGTYTYWVCIGNGLDKAHPNVTSESNKIEIIDNSKNNFEIIQLQMYGVHDDVLWPDDASNNYKGTSKRDNAFSLANTIIKATKTYRVFYKNDDGTSLDLSTNQAIIRWTVTQAYGAFVQADGKITILAAIEDSPLYADPLGSYIAGFTIPPDEGHITPPIALILNNRIRAHETSTYDIARACVGTAIHELGHSIGITNDDPNTIPPHSGSNEADCLMHAVNPVSRYTNPVFCGNHIQFISTQTWFK